MDNNIAIQSIIDKLNNPSFYRMSITEEGITLSESLDKDKLISIFKKKLIELGIDITKDDYLIQNSGAFKSFEKEIIANSNGLVISAAWFIEKYMVKEDLLEKIYSPYDMRITRNLTFEEMNQEKFADALAGRYMDADITRNIKRTGDKSGLLERLCKVGFDLRDFEGEETEKHRLLFLIYCFERDNRCTIVEYFSKPSYENREDNQFYVKNRNGELTHYLKSKLEMQIPPEELIPYGFSFNQIINGWQNQFSKILRKVDEYHEKETHNDLGMTNLYADFIFMEDSLVDYDKQGPYRDGVLRSFYLKILEFEHTGIELDLRDIEEWELSTDHINGKSDYLKKYDSDTVSRLTMQAYFNERLSIFTKYLYGVEYPNKNIKKRYRRLLENLPYFIDVLSGHGKADDKEAFPVLLLLACMFEYVHMGDEKVDNHFFRYKTSDQKTLTAELKNGSFAFMKNKCAWISRSYYRYNIIMDREGAEYIAKRIIWKLQDRFLKVMKCRSIFDTLVINNFYMNSFDRHFLPWYEIEADMDELDRRIQLIAPRYKLVNRQEENTRLFFATIHENPPAMDYLVKKMSELIQFCDRYNRSERIGLKFEFTQNLYGGIDRYFVQIEACPEEGFLFTWNFKPQHTKEEYEIFMDNGFYKEIGDRY